MWEELELAPDRFQVLLLKRQRTIDTLLVLASSDECQQSPLSSPSRKGFLLTGIIPNCETHCKVGIAAKPFLGHCIALKQVERVLLCRQGTVLMIYHLSKVRKHATQLSLRTSRTCINGHAGLK